MSQQNHSNQAIQYTPPESFLGSRFYNGLTAGMIRELRGSLITVARCRATKDHLLRMAELYAHYPVEINEIFVTFAGTSFRGLHRGSPKVVIGMRRTTFRRFID
jgi:hypothetical protein